MIKVSFSFNIFARYKKRGKEREFRFDLRRREGGSPGWNADRGVHVAAPLSKTA